DILYQPSAVFDRRREGKFGMALLVIVVVTTVLFFALRNGLAPVMDAEMAKQAAAMAAKNPQITPEQIAASQGMMEKFAVVGYVVFVPVGIVIIAALLWLAGKVVDAKVAFAAAMMIATYSWFPRIIEMILNAVQGLLLSPESITSRYSVQLGPARFFDSASTSPVLLTFLGGIDLFTIWTTALMAIGLSVVARVPRSRGAIAAVAIWFVMMLIPLYQALST
ncbi:MAG TPA: YIP1 family protein, partial [Gemmatimonadaceae bacterium]|nr:YIP1 family protein [Gemmatimonadaceae bacterium]